MKRICVFCGSKKGGAEAYARAATDLGQEMASQGLSLVYGGGGIGLMGVVADAVLAGGGEAIGVLPRFLSERELGHGRLTQLILVDSMHERKQKMAELADGFIAMPGGFGTLEELCEILTWRQLRLIQKPVGLLNTDGFFNRLIDLIQHMIDEGFLEARHRSLLYVEEHPRRLLQAFGSFAASESQEIDKT